ncbi:MAG: Maf family protein [bacterium]|nr:Maf family protein [bacterium]
MRKLILASASPWRRKILKSAGISFVVEKSGYKENLRIKLQPAALAKKLALGKAMAVARLQKDAIVIGADTLIMHRKKILGKPKTPALAKAMLHSLSGATHTIITGFAIVDSRTKKYVIKSAATRVTFNKLTEEQVDEYVKTGEPLRAAGGYAIQDGGSKLIKGIKGDYNNVAGLPLRDLIRELEKFTRGTEDGPR